jgi:hypothetical protein
LHAWKLEQFLIFLEKKRFNSNNQKRWHKRKKMEHQVFFIFTFFFCFAKGKNILVSTTKGLERANELQVSD